MTIAFSVITFVLLFLTPSARATCPSVKSCLAGSQVCSVLPLPSFPPFVPVESFSLTKVRPGVFSFGEGDIMTLIIFKNRRLVIADAPMSAFSFKPGGDYKLLSAIKKVLSGAVPKQIDLIYGHRHVDHIGGMPIVYKFLKRKFASVHISVWGSDETEDQISRNRKFGMPEITDKVGATGRTIHVAPTIRLKLILFSGHVLEDMAVFIPPSSDGAGIVHLVDFVTPGFSPFHRFSQSDDLGRWINSQEKLLKLNFTTLSSGHASLGSRRDVRLNIAYSRDAIRFGREAENEVTRKMVFDAGFPLMEDPKAPQFRNVAFALKATIDLQAAICKRKLIQKYGCRLGGVAEFAESQCVEVFFYNRIKKF